MKTNNETLEPTKFSNFKAAYILETEGGEYAVCHYCNGSNFADQQTAKLWNEAKNAFNALREHLKVELNEIEI